MVHTWRCRRTKGGVVCDTLNLARKRRCTKCGKARPAKRRPKHMAVLATTTYEECVALFGERCSICGAGPGTRRLQRDHEHKGAGSIRGLLCVRCNRALPSWITPQWLRRAAFYLEQHEERKRQA